MSKAGGRRPLGFQVANGRFGVTEDRSLPARESQVRALERRLGEGLPKDYRRFLLTINGGRRPGGGWELPGTNGVDRFFGVRNGAQGLGEEIEAALKPGSDRWLKPDTFPVAHDIQDNPYVIQYRGKGKGSIWYWDDEWVPVAPSFMAFLRKLRQAPDPPGEEELRRMVERDDAKALRVHLDGLPAAKLNEPDVAQGYTLLQRAADAGAVDVTRLLLSRGAWGIIGLSTANWRGHVEVVALLLDHGYKPTKADWGSAVGSGSAALVRIYLRHGPMPPRAVLRERLAAARNLLAGDPSADRREVVRMLSRLVEKMPGARARAGVEAVERRGRGVSRGSTSARRRRA